MARGNRAAVYIRVYPADYREVEARRRAIDRHCDKNGLAVVDYYIDNGVREQMPLEDTKDGVRLLKDAADGRFDVVMCYTRSDLGMRQSDQQRITSHFEALGIEVRDLRIYLGTERSGGLTIVKYGIDDPDRAREALEKAVQILLEAAARSDREQEEQRSANDETEPRERDDEAE